VLEASSRSDLSVWKILFSTETSEPVSAFGKKQRRLAAVRVAASATVGVSLAALTCGASRAVLPMSFTCGAEVDLLRAMRRADADCDSPGPRCAYAAAEPLECCTPHMPRMRGRFVVPSMPSSPWRFPRRIVAWLGEDVDDQLRSIDDTRV